MEQVAIAGEGGSLWIPKKALRDALYATSDYEGLTGRLTCQGPGSENPGDCATGEALAVFQLDAATVADPDAEWPPEVVWKPGM
jgi:branched-chain amino acid transport system substrate-binding protein